MIQEKEGRMGAVAGKYGGGRGQETKRTEKAGKGNVG